MKSQQTKSNRKLKRNVVFTSQEAYNLYQVVLIKWLMKHYNWSETEAAQYYIKSGLAQSFEDHHRTYHGNDIEVSEVGQEIV